MFGSSLVGCILRISLMLLCVGSFAAHAGQSDKISYQRKLDDTRIEKDFSEGLRWVDKALDKERIHVRVFNGYTLLFGSADNEALRTKAEELANSLANVRQVFNQLKVGEKDNNWLDQKVLNARIRSNLLTTSNIDSSRIRFESLHDRVYLLGLLTEKEAQLVVSIVSDISGIGEVITLFEYVDN